MTTGRVLLAVTVLAGLAAGCAGRGGRHAGGVSVPGSTVALLATTTLAVTPSTTSASSTTSTTPRVAITPVPSAPPSTAASAPPPAGGPAVAGCPLFPADNPWRRGISADAVDPHSAAWVASIGQGTHVHPDFGSDPSYGIPYVVVPANQPKVPITFTAYGDQSDPGPYPVPPNAPIEAGSDHHVLVASGDCHLYEMYNAAPDGRGGWNADSGAVFDLRSDRLRPDTWTSADAAGLPILPGLVRLDEIQAGHIDHALRFTVSRTQRGFIHPATHQAGSTTDPNVPPMGARFRLRASFDTSAFHGAARVILECLR